jgi:hypothetical protein
VAGPVLVAAVFLAVIGASVGFVLGLSRNDDRGGQGQPTSVEQTQPPEDTPSVEAPEPGDEGEVDEEPAGYPKGDRCPKHTQKLAADAGAAGALDRQLYIRTSYSEVWICNDDDGRLFYQGRQLTKGPGFVEGTNALFLTTVTTDGPGYLAVNNDTTYRVGATELVIERRSGKRVVEPVVEHQP